MTDRPPPPDHTVYKRRRLQGACDICKYKKIRCDSAKMPDNRCTNCISFNAECTHSVAPKKRASLLQPYSPRSTTNRILLNHLSQSQTASGGEIHPFVQTVLSPSSDSHSEGQSSLVALSQYIFNLEQDLNTLRQETRSTTAGLSQPPFLGLKKPPLSDETNNTGTVVSTTDEADLAAQLKKLTVAASHTRHFGPSSLFALLGTALRVQKGAQNKPSPQDDSSSQFQRPIFWTIHPWESLSDNLPMYQFPDLGLMHELVDLYFDHVNVYWPLLHRPTFESDLKKDLYLTNPHFGALVLAVCSVASRYSDDPKVLLEGFDSRHSAGWKWYTQIRQFWRSSSRTLSLYEIQAICLSILFTQGTSQPEACWVMIGIGIRFAQDVGAHRKKANERSIESELWKRCFWILVCSDTIVCAFLGRPRATVSDDFTLDLLLECDDEYWETGDPTSRFVQPPDKPSKLSYFNTFLKLMKILEYAQRTLSDEEIVSYLDSELNQWFERIPSHLVWTTCTPGTLFYEQSAILHACYHHIRIIVHRPFIPLPKKPSPLPFPSLAICTNAARSCVHVLTAQSRTNVFLPFHHVQFAIFTSAIILLVNHWTNLKPNQISRDMNENMKNVYDCISILSKLEERWTPAGRFCDAMRGLYSYGDSTSTSAPIQQDMPSDRNDNYQPTSTALQLHPLQASSPRGNEVQMSWDTISSSSWNSWHEYEQKIANRVLANEPIVSNTDWWDGLSGCSVDPMHPDTDSYPNHGEDLYTLHVSNDPSISQRLPTIHNGMGVGDAVMLWLQQPEEWMNLGRYDLRMD